MGEEKQKAKTRYKVHVNGGQHEFIEAENAFEAAKEATGASKLKKVDPKKNPPAGYKITTYENDDVSVEVIEG